jgi:hypothetical protein
VTNLRLPSRAVVRFYNKRGTAEQWIKEGKQAAHWTRLSCRRFRANEVRLQLSVLTYNLGNLWRRLTEGIWRRKGTNSREVFEAMPGDAPFPSEFMSGRGAVEPL